MIVYFGTNGQLLETIDTYTLENSSGNVIDKSFITASGNISSNKIFAFIEGETPTALQCSITYKMPNGSIFGNSSIPCDGIVQASIAYDHDRDIYHFKYGKVYRFLEFDLPSALLTTGGEGAYWTNITLYPSTQQARAYSQFSFKAGGSPSQLVENEITDTQYQLILAQFSDCVPYTGASDNVDLGDYYITAFSLTARQENFSIIIGANEDVEPTIFVTDNNGEFYYNFPNEPIDEEYSFTIATQEWVSAQGFVPYADATSDVNLGIHSLTANQVYLSTTYSGTDYTAWFGIATQPESRRGLVYIYDGTHSRQFNFPNDGDALQNIATREWATSQFLTETAGDAKYLPLTGGELSGSVLVKNPTQAFNYIGIEHIYDGSAGSMVAFLSETNVDLTNPSPMLMLGDSTARNRGIILDTLGFKVGSGNVLAEQHRLLLPRDETGSANKTLATREWAQGLLTPNAVGSATTSANVNGYNGAKFTIGDNNGLYFFTYGNCSVMIPVYGLVAGTEYKIASALNGGGQAGFQVKVLTYRLTGDGDLQIYQKENFIPTGYTAYLMRIKLY